MYFNKAVNRINKIEWSKLGKSVDNDEKSLGYEYLRRMARFIKEQSIKSINLLIQLLERGLIFGFREGGLMIYNTGYYPLSGWYDRFLE